MIVRLSGKLVEKQDHAVVIDVQGLSYEVLVPVSIMKRIDDACNEEGRLSLIIYHYIQIAPSKGTPCLVGFLNGVERDFFLDFIKVSGIGPRAAVKALEKPISEIAGAIARNDQAFLKGLPGIGLQKAKEIVAKLQSKVGRYGLIQDAVSEGVVASGVEVSRDMTGWQQGALDVLLQLQYKKGEAQQMIRKALERNPDIQTAEELLNEIYNQRINA